MSQCEKEKEQKEKDAKSFTCPFCSRFFKGPNLRHLLDCAMKTESSTAETKLKAFFEQAE